MTREIKQKTSKGGMVRRLLITLILALCLITISSSPIFALSLEDYFTINYDIELSETEIPGSKTFYATFVGAATCKRDLPLRVTEGYITSRVVAEHQGSSVVVTLNSSYTINIDSFPDQAGDSTQATEVVSLSFPSGSQSGTYHVVGRPIEAKINTTRGWINLTPYLPAPEAIGTVTYAPVSGGGEVVEVVETPAAFTASNLTITPAEVNIGEEVTISALVTNTGDLSGSYEVILKIDGVAVATKQVTLAGGASETVTFTTTKDVAGTYSVTIDGLSGTFELKVAPKPIDWRLITIIAGVTTAIAVPLAIRRRRLA